MPSLNEKISLFVGPELLPWRLKGFKVLVKAWIGNVILYVVHGRWQITILVPFRSWGKCSMWEEVQDHTHIHTHKHTVKAHPKMKVGKKMSQ